jgi:AraC-like DNA-binding protein
MGARVSLPPEEGDGYFELTQIRDDIYVVVQNFAYKDLRIEFVPGDGLIQFNFKVSGDMTLDMSRPQPLRFNRPSLLIWQQPQGVDMEEWTAPSAHERNVAISVTPKFLNELMRTSVATVPDELESFVASDLSQINYCQVPLTAQMCDAVTKILENPYSGTMALVYTEAIALELLCSAIGEFSLASSRPNQDYTDQELRCLQSARNVLMRQFSPPPSIRSLARSVGLSETKLRRAFRAVFGETVFQFSLRCRMEHALTLLRDRRFGVARASMEVGYSHSTSFATAFRKQFGMTPIEARRPRFR